MREWICEGYPCIRRNIHISEIYAASYPAHFACPRCRGSMECLLFAWRRHRFSDKMEICCRIAHGVATPPLALILPRRLLQGPLLGQPCERPLFLF